MLLGVALSLTAAGCSEAGPDREAGPDQEAGASQASGDRHGIPPTGPAVMSQAELDEALAQAPPGPPRSNAEMLAQFWESTGIEGEPPAAQHVRTVGPEEANAVFATCLGELGFPSTVDQVGQQGIALDKSQQDDYHRASYVCLARYPLDEMYREPFSLGQLRILYDWRVGQTVPCLRADGVTVPDPPSFETFVARYAATGYEHWSPYSEELQLPPEWDVQQCPDTPPDDVLYPGT